MRAIVRHWLEVRKSAERRDCIRKLAELGRRMEEMEARIAEMGSMVHEHESYLDHQAMMQAEGDW